MSLESITEIIEIKIFDDIPSDEYFLIYLEIKR